MRSEISKKILSETSKETRQKKELHIKEETNKYLSNMENYEKLERVEKTIRNAIIDLEDFIGVSAYVDLKKLISYMDDSVFFLNAEIKGIPLSEFNIKPTISYE